MVRVDTLLSTIPDHLAPKLVFSSNATPDIIISLKELLKSQGRSQQAPDTEVVEEGGVALKLIRPEIIFEGFGRIQSFAPYGKPFKHAFAVIIASIVTAGLISAAITWHICRNKIVSKKNKALIEKLKVELGPDATKQLKKEAAAIKKLAESS